MTAPETLSHPVVAPASRHEHAWVTSSSHATSEGRIRYVRCVDCGAHRVDLEPRAVVVPEALTRPLG
ncbi:hypothetical protein [Microbacterium sp. LMI1-1-1.1]|uniref:hypothetical protein n=1 Tax=unclassified Microbacterium TaxID=2609290 RepID=UPI0034668301